MLNYQRIATGQENRERESTEQADYQAALNINTQNAGMTWDVVNALTNYENDTRRIILAYGAKRGWTGEQMQSELMGAITKQVASAATAAFFSIRTARAVRTSGASTIPRRSPAISGSTVRPTAATSI